MKRLTAIVFLCGVVNFLTSCSMPEQTHDSIPWQIYAEPGQTSGKLLPGLGDTYVGDLLSGKMHGHGTYTYSGGEKYVGTFANGLMSGKGTFTWPPVRPATRGPSWTVTVSGDPVATNR